MAVRKYKFPSSRQNPLGYREENATWGADATSTKRLRAAPSGKGCIVWIGQSNIEGAESDYVIDAQTVDAPFPGLFEISRGIHQAPHFRVPAIGEPMVAREPSQDDTGGGTSPKRACGQRLLQMDVGLEEVYFFSGALGGSGFDSDDWKPGSSWLLNRIGELNTFLNARPDVPVIAFVWGQGAQDAVVGMERAEYEGYVTALAAQLRTDVTNSADALWISVSTHPVLIAQNFGATPAIPGNRVDGGTYQDIYAAQQGVADTVPHARYLDMTDMTDTDDGRHWTSVGIGVLAHRCAEMIADDLLEGNDRPATPPCRMLYSEAKGAFVDQYGGGFSVFGSPTIETDGDLGECIRINGDAYDTDLPLRTSGGYTKFLRIKPMVSPGNLQWLLLTGRWDETIPGTDPATPYNTTGHYWTIRAVTHLLADGVALCPIFIGPDVAEYDPASVLALDTVSSLAVTWDGVAEEWRLYFDGLLVEPYFFDPGTTAGFPTSMAAGQPETESMPVQINGWGSIAGATSNYRITDFGTLPWVATPAQVLAWHTGGPQALGGFAGL